jgi:hypothetical protein
MSTSEGDDPRDSRDRRDRDQDRGQHIGVGGGDDSVSRIQLAARWAEAYPGQGDSLSAILKRFRVAYDYLDAVIHGVEPPELDSLEAAPAPAAASAPPWPAPHPPAPTPPPAPGSVGAPPPWASPGPESGAPPPEPRPWA